MRDLLWKYRALIGYLFLLAVTLFALSQHQHAIARDDAARDRQSCAQRQVLARNQAFVLRALSNVLRAEIHDDAEAMSESVLRALVLNLDEAERRLAEENPIKPCDLGGQR